MEDPSKELPRDPTGSYLHLKLKRYGRMKDLPMKYAISTWKKYPQDAEVDISPASRSSCRQCHSRIEKGNVRMRLFLQCHKGCKNIAYFHEECFWKYPETKKLESIKEIYNVDKLPKESQALVTNRFREFRKRPEAELKDAEPEATAEAEETTYVGKEDTLEKPRKRRKTK
mmetsp:Transcript_68386/g.103123  ORF Transcript_68386/g.103123 Transcript_68386/m.103123 type:complete len:171 (-) Transcript_68386:32-544(-)|eukprot:CAMPEP_0117002450 /NCGR_PEP_ID=MMETSP0472-20121206/4125_1 /TAXON_ID=693140 ORGANISM="Tiarina fusus, Strain LIS" /NCGR_SAMPLE_ID=MMETSP0472 /ASSEMBLY_ACC=CAM_ASM_000603 /LENGTH=170 /DNA_ID=CAMNT_0004702821 /DNA_START=144 /DNA_END=656 /DNA_ORIENTATION=+